MSVEIFQNRLSNLISKLEGVVCIADDIIIHRKNGKEHDIRMNKFIKRCEKERIALNKEKMEHKLPAVTFVGHKITEKGLEVDPEKVKAIEKFPAHTNVSQLRGFLGLTNFIAEFIPKSTDIVHPLHNLLKTNVPWNWSKAQEAAFQAVKDEISKANKLSY